MNATFAIAVHPKEVTDQLFLSIWLEPSARLRRLRHFRSLLRLFPFSQREQPQSTLSIQAVSTAEPPLLERSVNGPLDIDDIEESLKDYEGSDLAYEVESWWDLWQFDADWKLAPARVTLSCFSNDFDNGTEREVHDQEDLRIEFGLDSSYLPMPDVPGSARLVESNVKSLLRLVHEIDSTLPVAKRLLETESGENFADRLQESLVASDRVQ